ncbi:MAG: hypothetical protein ACFFAE_13305 [Candidatus Hodarchaeota archaeon]
MILEVLIDRPTNQATKSLFNGTRVVVAAFGILCGLTGIIAGFFEILQGNKAPTGFIISTIGPNYSMADDFTYFAITIIPNFLLTGILAIIISCLVIIWSVKYVHRKYGMIILLVLSIMQMLVGGGWVIDLATITCILATRIDKPLNWWRSHLPNNLRLWLTKILPFSLIGYVIIALNMLVLSILGINNMVLIEIITILATVMFIPMMLMIFGGLANDLQKQLIVDLEAETN